MIVPHSTDKRPDQVPTTIRMPKTDPGLSGWGPRLR